jgi:hypothetical protein
MAARKSVLPKNSTESYAQPAKCGVCDNGPEFRCPTCPKRESQHIKPFDHGWKSAFAHDREMAQALMRDAKTSRALVTTHESHPAYEALALEYARSGIALMVLRSRRHKWPIPPQTMEWLRKHDAEPLLD